jgi:hypothetical protein
MREYRTTIDGEKLPDNIKDATDLIVNELIACTNCRRAYRIVSDELTFLRRFNLPLPHQCPDCRYKARMAFRTPYEWHERTCDCLSTELQAKADSYKNLNIHPHGTEPCQEKFTSPYSLDRPEAVYCEICYQQEVV